MSHIPSYTLICTCSYIPIPSICTYISLYPHIPINTGSIQRCRGIQDRHEGVGLEMLFSNTQVSTDKIGVAMVTMTTTYRDSFVMEYCGEVCTPEEFEIRRKNYELDKRRHYYFMSLKTDEASTHDTRPFMCHAPLCATPPYVPRPYR